MFGNEDEKALEEMLLAYGIETTHEQRACLLKYLELLLEKNKVLNLTSITDPAEALILHIVDSLVVSLYMKEGKTFCDIGTGGGTPGIPLGCVTGFDGVLIDSVRMKVTAVNEFIEQLGLQKHLVGKHMRAEEITPEMKRVFDFVVSRAVGKTNIIIEYAEPFLTLGGCLLVQKANLEKVELQEASQAAALCGFENVSRETFELPQGLGHREILIYRKVKQAQIKLPRKNGRAKREPLGHIKE